MTKTEEDRPGYTTIRNGFNLYSTDLDIVSGELSEIYGPSILLDIPFGEIEDHINSWYQALSVDGTLTIGGIDPYVLSKHLVHRSIDLEMYNDVVFSCKSLSPISYIRPILESKLKMKIQSIDLSYKDFNFVIKAIKK